ncbi:uncharacterized protein EDB91DRAFT_1084065 [Suillus paluster]|uniref:uncharacterized protein n=1 Tax=Suillus paluster TaxID=48578 RepID=UPI001B884E5C|nr:uncharacterized protein EDB91DRAFT_1084065 [Suillus paluster]KAG1734406.1 hypothetical protein EDB91DRAFT_1084065 [Suillus paluster]
MRFSFLLAVVAALTTSMSVSATRCTGLYGACSGPIRAPLPCCSGFTCKKSTQHVATWLIARYAVRRGVDQYDYFYTNFPAASTRLLNNLSVASINVQVLEDDIAEKEEGTT